MAVRKRKLDLRKALFVLPNLFTLGSLFCGFFAIAQSFHGGGGGPTDLYRAGIAILFAMFFDTFDGRIARLTKTQSALGMELDSLADVVSFGVAPAALVYNWGLNGFGIGGQIIAFTWIACGAIRLARFNVLAQRAGGKPGKYIVGLPIPVAASVIVALVVVAHATGAARVPVGQAGLAATVLALAYLMVSRIKFRSFKQVGWRSRRTYTAIVLLAVASVALWVELKGAFVFLFLVLLYIGLGLAEALLFRGKPATVENPPEIKQV
jgi:CDP-diacylglycerol--serine O-phosphatidyltransferase